MTSALLDLHLHTTCSDGLLTPDDLIQRALQEGLRLVAIADHDSVAGIDTALATAAGTPLSVLPAVELSVAYGDYRDVHLLGYGIRHTDPDFAALLEKFRNRRLQRGKEIMVRINQLLARDNRSLLDFDEALAASGDAFGRPHLGRLLIAKGLVSDLNEAFSRYLGPCNVPKQYLPFSDALAEIHRLGGAAVLAHPVSLTSERQELSGIVRDMVDMGLDGLEVYCNLGDNSDCDYLVSLANRYRLLQTGGSDFHGDDTTARLGYLSGGRPLPPRLYPPLAERFGLPYSR